MASPQMVYFCVSWATMFLKSLLNRHSHGGRSLHYDRNFTHHSRMHAGDARQRRNQQKKGVLLWNSRFTKIQIHDVWIQQTKRPTEQVKEKTVSAVFWEGLLHKQLFQQRKRQRLSRSELHFVLVFDVDAKSREQTNNFQLSRKWWSFLTWKLSTNIADFAALAHFNTDLWFAGSVWGPRPDLGSQNSSHVQRWSVESEKIHFYNIPTAKQCRRQVCGRCDIKIKLKRIPHTATLFIHHNDISFRMIWQRSRGTKTSLR